MKMNEDEKYIYCVDDRIRLEKSSNCVEIMCGKNMTYRLYPVELATIIEAIVKNGFIEMLAVIKSPSDMHGTLKLHPFMKWSNGDEVMCECCKYNEVKDE